MQLTQMLVLLLELLLLLLLLHLFLPLFLQWFKQLQQQKQQQQELRQQHQHLCQLHSNFISISFWFSFSLILIVAFFSPWMVSSRFKFRSEEF